MAQALTNRVNVKNVSMKYSSADHSERWAWRHRMDSTMLLYPPTQKGDIYRSNFIFFPFSFSFDVLSRKRRNLYFNADECFFFFQKRKSDTKVKCFLLTGKIYIYIYWILDAMLNYLSARNSLHGRDTKRSCSVSESVKWLKLFP